jgi:predicted nucleic acid-binding protein
VIWFVDTSALAKRYVNEPGSQWLRREVAQHQVLLAQITSVEMMAALGRRFRQGQIPQFALYQARRRFLTHRAQAQYQIIDLTAAIVEEAMRLAVVYDVRAYDAVQLATALSAVKGVDRSRFVFVTADFQLEAASVAEGLLVENPLNY